MFFATLEQGSLKFSQRVLSVVVVVEVVTMALCVIAAICDDGNSGNNQLLGRHRSRYLFHCFHCLVIVLMVRY